METHLDEVLFMETLEELRLVSTEDLNFAKQKAYVDSVTVPEVLLQLGFLSSTEMTKIIGMTKGVGFVDLADKHMDMDALQTLSEPMSRSNGLVCFKSDENSMSVACVDLKAFENMQTTIEKKHNKKVVPYMTDKKSLTHALKTYQKHQADTFGQQISSQLGRVRNPDTFKGIEDHLPERFHTEISEDVSINKIMKNILEHAFGSDASHIYITPTQDETVISYRISGTLYDAMRLPTNVMPSLTIKLRHMIDKIIIPKKDEGRVVSGYAVHKIDTQDLSLQVLLFKTPHGTKAVIRLLPEGSLFDATEALFPSTLQQDVLYKHLHQAESVLLAGPAKSGVTRTYYGLLENLSLDHKEVVSIESPLEVVMPRITQLQPDTKKDTKKLVSQIITTRPDVIGLSPFSLKEHAAVLATSKTTMQSVLEVGDMQKFIQSLDANALLVPQVVSGFSLIISHQPMWAVNDSERHMRKLSKTELESITRYISQGELLAFLDHEDMLASGITKLADVQVASRKKVKRSLRTEEKSKVYVRGITTIEEVVKASRDNMSKVTVSKNLRLAQKRSILENALMLSIQGEVSISDIITYLNN